MRKKIGRGPCTPARRTLPELEAQTLKLVCPRSYLVVVDDDYVMVRRDADVRAPGEGLYRIDREVLRKGPDSIEWFSCQPSGAIGYGAGLDIFDEN